MGGFEMAISIPRGQSDETIEKIAGGLRTYEANHPKAKIDLYRQNPVSVRVRIVDPHFAGKSKSERSQEAWKYLDNVPDEAHSDISTLILLTPDELTKSFANMDFEDPIPSNL